MRDTKFRGQRVDNGEWLRDSENIIRRKDWDGKKWTERVFLLDGHSCNETPRIENFIEVHLDTVGQYTGRNDIENTEAYVGDKIITEDMGDRTIEWLDLACGWVCFDEKRIYCRLSDIGDFEITGTIHDKEKTQ